MRTREFASDSEVEALVRAFENASIPASEFTHAAHIAVALSYLDTFPPEQALERMRENIRSFAAVMDLPIQLPVLKIVIGAILFLIIVGLRIAMEYERG